MDFQVQKKRKKEEAEEQGLTGRKGRNRSAE